MQNAGVMRIRFVLSAAVIAMWAVTATALDEIHAQRKVEAAGAAYAKGNYARALFELSAAARGKQKTIWGREALLLAARIKQFDMDEEAQALRAYRDLALAHPRTPQGIMAQAHIAETYRRGGKWVASYHEYLRLSKIPPLEVVLRTEPGSGEGERVKRGTFKRLPKVRADAEMAERAIEWADAVAIDSWLRIPAARRPRELPARAEMLTKDGQSFGSKQSLEGKNSTVTMVKYIIAPPGYVISGARCEIEGNTASGSSAIPVEGRHCTVIVSTLDVEGGPADRLVLGGSSRKRERLAGKIDFKTPGQVIRVEVSASGAVIHGWKIVPARKRAPGGGARPAAGVRPVPVPLGGGYSPCLVRDEKDGAVTCVFNDVGPQRERNVAASADLYITRSRDGGKSWTRPARLPVSSATDDISPAIVKFPDGPYVLFWASDRLSGGQMGLYFSSSVDTAKWTPPRKIETGKLPSLVRDLVTIESVSAELASKELVRVVVSATGSQHTSALGERYHASGVYLINVTRQGNWTEAEAIYSTDLKAVSMLPGSPRNTDRKERVSSRVPVDMAALGPTRVGVVWNSRSAGPYLSLGHVGGRWQTAYNGLGKETEFQVWCRLEMLRSGRGGMLLLAARASGLWAYFTTARGAKAGEVAVTQGSSLPPGMPAACHLGDGKYLVVWGHDLRCSPSGLYSKVISEPAGPPRRR